jgi:NAD(P)-dependent dehydrogenase (short-subunit alcohol dehydrogenase family)
MKLQLKPVRDQVIVITGASSGIGLVTAKMAGARGARVVLAARNARDLERAVEQIRAAGGRAVHVVADVSDEAQVQSIADAAVHEFGRIDTWVNDAGVSIYGHTMDVEVADMRRLFDVTFWGTVFGSRAAVPLLRRQGGALINVASAVADRAIPLQGIYCAAKHAVKGFTDTLRMELEDANEPISVSLVKPGSIDTPLFGKAKTLFPVEPQPVPPVYAPELAAEAILHCAEHPKRDIVVGGLGKMIQLAALAPKVADAYMERTTFDSQLTTQPIADDRRDNLYEPVEYDGGERGRTWTGRTKETSVYTWAARNPRRAAALTASLAAAAAGARALMRRREMEAPTEREPIPTQDTSPDARERPT